MATFEESDVDQIRAIFERFDTNCNGTIDYRELKLMIRSFGQYWSDRQAREVVAALTKLTETSSDECRLPSRSTCTTFFDSSERI